MVPLLRSWRTTSPWNQRVATQKATLLRVVLPWTKRMHRENARKSAVRELDQAADYWLGMKRVLAGANMWRAGEVEQKER